jgi:hypothetical protein
MMFCPVCRAGRLVTSERCESDPDDRPNIQTVIYTYDCGHDRVAQIDLGPERKVEAMMEQRS